MSRLVVIVPLKAGMRERADGLLKDGPPFDLEKTQFDRHHVFVTDREVVFVFESDGSSPTLHLPGEDPGVWRAAKAWRQVMAERPRIASTAYSWVRTTDPGA
ncbi:MAG: hypothetical protein ACRDON_07620 [Gaiellaceae bacterium]